MDSPWVGSSMKTRKTFLLRRKWKISDSAADSSFSGEMSFMVFVLRGRERDLEREDEEQRRRRSYYFYLLKTNNGLILAVR